jgi:uncharacterized protein
MNSALYRAKVMHHRLAPKKHSFHYNVFMFYIDLDELEMLKRFHLISINRFNIFSFRNKDHIELPAENPEKKLSTKQHVLNYLSDNGIIIEKPRVMLLTNFCTFGYQFNPVSFYFIYDGEKCVSVVAEVSNTFREMKPYFIGSDKKDGETFKHKVKKMFYVSPFIPHDAIFDFTLAEPGEKLNIRIDDLEDDKRFFISTLTGDKKALTNARLWAYAVRFPFITLKVIGLIHWNALLLWLKKLRFYRKKEFPELQKDMLKPYKEA